MSIRRGLMLLISVYSLAILCIPTLVPLITEGALEVRLPLWVHPATLMVFALSWAQLWEDYGAAAERNRQKEASHDN